MKQCVDESATNESSIKIQSESCTLAVSSRELFQKLLSKLVLVVMSISFMSWRVIGVEKLAPSTKLRPQRKFNRCFRVAAKLAKLMILTRAGAKNLHFLRDQRKSNDERGPTWGARIDDEQDLMDRQVRRQRLGRSPRTE